MRTAENIAAVLASVTNDHQLSIRRHCRNGLNSFRIGCLYIRLTEFLLNFICRLHYDGLNSNSITVACSVLPFMSQGSAV